MIGLLYFSVKAFALWKSMAWTRTTARKSMLPVERIRMMQERRQRARQEHRDRMIIASAAK